MISRRLLRVKILQVLYANSSKPDHSINLSEKDLFFSIQKSYDLFHLLLLLPIELLKVEEQRIDMAKQRLMATKEDKNPNTRLVDNRIINQLKKNWALSKYVSDNKISWVNFPELIKNLYNIIKEKDYFKSYMTLPSTFENDKKFILKIMENEIPQFLDLESTLEEMSIFWNDDIELVLGMVIKTIKSFKESDQPSLPLMDLYKNEDDKEFAKQLLRKSIVNSKEYNELIQKHAQNWEFERIAQMDILIMQIALCEILEFPSIPVKVTLNEFIDIAKDYSTPNSNTFINGILDNIVKEMKLQNKIIKVGRGLMDN